MKMLTIKEYMKRAEVTKKEYVVDWISKDLIPGVVCEGEEYRFPDSARRPYRARTKKKNASTIRASIVNACLKRQHVTNRTFNLSEGEFRGFIQDLVNSGLITERIEDEITYYDSTVKSDEFKGKSFRELISCISKMLQTVGPAFTVAANIATIATSII